MKKKAFEEFRKEVSFMIGLRDRNIVCMLAFSLQPRYDDCCCL
jgi:hypothetical protein